MPRAAIYDFFWGELCDWYIELIKPRLLAEEEAGGKSARASCANLVLLFEASLRLLHPIMPFITEEIWHAIYDGEPPLRSIALAAYPQMDSAQLDEVAENDMAVLQDVIVNVRNLRAELKVEQKQKVPVQIYATDSAIRNLIQQNQGAIERLANVDSIAFSEKSLANLPGARGTTRFDVQLIYEKKIDVSAERERLRKDLDRYEKEISNGQRQLLNEQFLAKAPEQVVEGIRKRAEELEVLIRTTRSKLDGL